jgi:hypothetical protein
MVHFWSSGIMPHLCSTEPLWYVKPSVSVVWKRSGDLLIHRYEGWFDNLPIDWRIEVSNNSWTTDEIGLRWLQELFIRSTSTRVRGRYRLLILDGYGSHLIP